VVSSNSLRIGSGRVIGNPIWLSSFRINERKVANYRAGRVFVAGDAAHVLGFPFVRKLAQDVTSEISIGYAHSPLNGSAHKDPSPGYRAPIRTGEPPVGAGSVPRFALFAEENGMPAELRKRYANLLEPMLCEPFHPGGIWLVRPDGHVALSATSGHWSEVAAYLDRI
jgi:hypothetical protein